MMGYKIIPPVPGTSTAGVAPTLAQAAVFNFTGADVGNVDVVYGSNVTNGNLLVVCAFGRSGGGASDFYLAGMLTLVGGSTATLGAITFDAPANITSAAPGTSAYPVGMWSAPVTGTGSATMRINHNFTPWAGSSTRSWVGIFELALANTGAGRVNATNSQVQTNITAVSSLSAATGGAGAMFGVMGAEDVAGTTTLTRDGAWTLGQSAEAAGATAGIGSIIYRLVGANTTDDASWTASSAIYPASIVVTYKAATP